MFSLLCIQYKVCSIDYFMNELQVYELHLILEHIHTTDRVLLESTRLLGYLQVQTQTTKKLSPQDIITYSFDEDNDVYEEEVDFNEVREMLQRANKLGEKIQFDEY